MSLAEFPARLSALAEQADYLLAHTSLSPQQATFVQHIARTAQHLQAQLAVVPATEYALQTLLPILGEDFSKPLFALFGYAKLLTDSPQSFDHAPLSADQRQRLVAIFEQGRSLAQWVEQLPDSLIQQRLHQRRAPASPHNLNDLLVEMLSVCRYLLRERPIRLSLSLPEALVWAQVNAYHVRELVRHVCLTTSLELIEQGELRLSLQSTPEQAQLSLNADQLVWDNDALIRLFMRNGRDTYTAYLTRYGGTWQADGEFLHLYLPLA